MNPVRSRFWMACVAVIALAQPAYSADAAKPVEADFVARDFRFSDGSTLPELRIHYRTIGAVKRDANGRATNVVLIMHGTGGSGASLVDSPIGKTLFAAELFGPGQPLDAQRFFIVVPDGLGHGKSSKPSDGMHARFPRYGYRDMVRAQHRLLTEGLKVDHLRLVMGTSMGGMHTWLWGEEYPDFMDALMPLASLPVQISGRNRMARRMIIDSIREDPEWKNGEYKTKPRGLTSAVYTLMMMSSIPLEWQKEGPTRDAADRFFENYVKTRVASTDANDLLYAVEASRNYNPQPKLDRIKARLLAVNSADDQVNPPELGIMEEEIRKVKNAKFVLIPISDQTRGHGTHSLPNLWKKDLAELLRATEK